MLALSYVRPRSVRRKLHGDRHCVVPGIDKQQTEAKQTTQAMHGRILVAASSARRNHQIHLVGSPHAIHCLQQQFESEGEFKLGDDDDRRLARVGSDDSHPQISPLRYKLV